MSKKTDSAGCFLVGLIVLFNVAWIGFLIWVIYTLVSWLVTK